MTGRPLSPGAQRLLAQLSLRAQQPPVERTVLRIHGAAHVAFEWARRAVRGLHAAGLVHVEAWAHAGPHGPLSPCWRAGPGVDAPYPQVLVRDDAQWLARPSVQRVADWLRAGGRGNVHDASQACFVSVETARQVFRRMHDMRLVVVCGWCRERAGMPAPIFQWRETARCRTDVPRPAARNATAHRKALHARIEQHYGPEVAGRILRSMTGHSRTPLTVVVDGRPIYRRGEGMLVSLRSAA